MSFEESEYNGVKIPAGMAPTRKEGESTVDEGLVAVDKNGNEWVWIEVPKTEMTSGLTFENETGYSANDETKCATITADLKKYADPYTKGSAKQSHSWADEWYEGCGLTQDEYKDTYQKMIKSVYKNGGFWIGRYEAGIEGTTGTDEETFKLERTKSSARIDILTSPKAISQKEVIPYNFVYCSEAQKLANEMTPDSSKTSSLLFGIQWDLVCKFLEVKSNDLNVADINDDSGKWGNYSNVGLPITSPNVKGFFIKDLTWRKILGNKLSYDDNNEDVTLLSTGASDNTKKSNIYDFAGNEFEWTLEHATADITYPCSSRGGSFNLNSFDYPVSHRNGRITNGAYGNNSFRPALY